MIVTGGDHKGRVGTVTRVIPSEEQVVVQGLNLRTKHMRPTRINPEGGVVTREAPIHLSKVSPAVTVEGRSRPTRVRFEERPDGSKVRIAVRTGEVLGEVRGAEAKKKK